MDRNVGISIGGLLGIVGGFLFNQIVITASAQASTFRNFAVTATKVGAILMMWFGGGAATGWASTKLFQSVVSADVARWYFVSLFVCVVIVSGYTIARYAIFAGNSVPFGPKASSK